MNHVNLWYTVVNPKGNEMLSLRDVLFKEIIRLHLNESSGFLLNMNPVCEN